MNINQIGEPSRIKSCTFDIREVSIQGQKYFAYYKKNTMNQDLDEYLALDLNLVHNCKYLRNYKRSADGHNYKAFEYPGEYKLLRDLIKPKEETILNIVSDLVSALMILHSNSLLGRCFNIDNIILINGTTPMLMEFGYYPKMDYKVPEQVISTQLNEKVDLFLLGRVIYYLTVGKELPNYTLNNFGENEDKINLAIAETNYSQKLKIFIQGLLQKNRSQRTDYLKLVQMFDTPNSSILLSFYQNEFQNCNIIINEQLQARQNQDVEIEEIVPFIIVPIINPNKIKGPYVQQRQKPNIIGDNLEPPESPSFLGDEDNFNPPILNTQHPLINCFEVDSEEINRELQNILPFYIESFDQQSIWNNIFFSLYRFGLVKKLNEMIKNFKRLSDDLTLWKTSFALSKIHIVLQIEFINDLNQDKNVFGIHQGDWVQFISKNKDYKIMKHKLQYELEKDQKLFIGLTFSQLYKGYSIFRQNPPQNDHFLNNNLQYETFEEYKLAYRGILSESLAFFEKCQGREYSLIKLFLLICLKINNICDIDAIQENFKYVGQVLNLPQVSSIKEIEYFFKNKSETNFDEFYNIIKSKFFAQNQQ
ncbi:unnamed protein product (macronuclear) [Paramecium tetraurelia]|uniref:Protein kinase domain-containing protein n=1 Tax=Paramecium tetraurelia TaxID=5888 RepID=A0C2Y7_PARTE|nr:uncharacterized protein GSPATT00034632001 [Paramecium tetraurelia]CAK65154.1 unnamed protein product [Paramecium tetraurelia]|eukprot:XP_001432551.1 hypothetical protein (macronuclear) [Paramecium tetraurelia strain d4-2]